MSRLKLEDLSRKGLIDLVLEYDSYVYSVCEEEANDMNVFPVAVKEYLNNQFINGKNEDDYKVKVISFADEYADIYTEAAAEIMDVFENILEENNISVPDDNREGAEGEARIFGETYYNMESQVEDILDSFVKQIHGSIIDKCKQQ